MAMPTAHKALGLATCLGLLLTSASASARNQDDAIRKLDGIWLFHDGDNRAFARADFDDLSWSQRRVPTSGTPHADRWAGYGWYRIHVDISKAESRKSMAFTLNTAGEAVEIYVNGALVGARGAFEMPVRGGARLLPLTALIAKHILHPGSNVIALRIFDPTFAGGIPVGPTILGPASIVQARAHTSAIQVTGLRIALALLALLGGLGALILQRRGRGFADTFWLTAAGFALAFSHIAGTGPFTWIPAPEFTERFGSLGLLAAAPAFAHFLTARFGDADARSTRANLLIVLAPVAAYALLPSSMIRLAGSSVVFVIALLVTLYSAKLVAQVARNAEDNARSVFVCIGLFALALLYDGIVIASHSRFPGVSAIVATVLLAVIGVLDARQAAHSDVTMVRLQSQSNAPAAPGDGTVLRQGAMPLTSPKRFLLASVREIARALAARRCSLMAPIDDSHLAVLAAVGLPRHVTRSPVQQEGSVAGWVFTHDSELTAGTIEKKMHGGRRGTTYATNAFICVPVRRGGKIVAVLSISDPNHGADFSMAEERALTELSETLGAAMLSMHPQSLIPVIESDPESTGTVKAAAPAKAKPVESA